MWMRLCVIVNVVQNVVGRCQSRLSKNAVSSARPAASQSLSQLVSHLQAAQTSTHTHTVAMFPLCMCVCVFCAHLKIKQHWKMLMPGDRQSDRPNPPTTYNRSTSRRPMPDLSRTPVCPHTHTQTHGETEHTRTPRKWQRQTASSSVHLVELKTEHWTDLNIEYFPHIRYVCYVCM